MNAKTKGVHHVALTVSNLDESTSFFINTLGWEKVGENLSYPANFISDGTQMIALWATKDSAPVAFDREKNVGLHHLALKVSSREELDSIFKSLESAPGVSIEFTPELLGDSPTIHGMFTEPSGNRIELILPVPLG